MQILKKDSYPYKKKEPVYHQNGRQILTINQKKKWWVHMLGLYHTWANNALKYIIIMRNNSKQPKSRDKLNILNYLDNKYPKQIEWRNSLWINIIDNLTHVYHEHLITYSSHGITSSIMSAILTKVPYSSVSSRK